MPSWIEQNIQACRAAGFDEAVFTRAAEILRINKTQPG
jgi:hypothetical protein